MNIPITATYHVDKPNGHVFKTTSLRNAEAEAKRVGVEVRVEIAPITTNKR